MKKKSRKASETPASHNGVYKIAEMAKAFGIPESVVYLWTIQEKLVTPDYQGRTQRPSLFLEKSAAVILMIDKMNKAGIVKSDIKRFISANRNLVFKASIAPSEEAVLSRGFIKSVVKVGLIRQEARKLLQEYVNAVQEKPSVEVSRVPEHREAPVEGAPGLASV